MQEITIGRVELEEKLESFYQLFSKLVLNDPNIYPKVIEQIDKHFVGDQDPEYYVSDEYLNYMLNTLKTRHGGLPSYAKLMGLQEMCKIFGLVELKKAIQDLSVYLTRNLSCKAVALVAYYPKGGIIDWHTNWDVPGQNVLFTRSDSTKSYFKYLDWKTKEIVTLNDKVGWNCRMGMYGTRKSEDVLYHCAESFGDRLTFGLSFVQKERNDDLHEMVKRFIRG